jgi:2-polyprenyl-3-methyl-5-hydroxy-6-metoxy-1,4-benzoquinol methylase
LEKGGSRLSSEEELESQLQRSWIENAAAWTGAVREGRIASRRAGTDVAIVEAVRQFPPCPVLDLGCGEGWLARVLSAEGYTVTGVDASSSLIEEASKAGGGSFLKMSYEDLVRERSIEGPFGLVVANYSLLGRCIQPLLEKVNSLLVKDGALIIQTLHPLSQDPDARDEPGWRTEAFTDIGDGFTAGMPYYFRTFSRWVEDLTEANFAIVHCREPLHPQTGRPLSLLIVARPV